MRVLVTGGTGYIGGAVVEALRAAGHSPVALAQSPKAAEGVRTRGAVPVRGDLRDPEGLAALARDADAVIHAANSNDADAAHVDTIATRAVVRSLAGTGRPFIYTSGAWVLGATGDRIADETAAPSPIPLVAWRAGAEADTLATPGVHGIVLRPAIVFGEDGGIPGMVARGELPVIGHGGQRWPLVHLRDLADLYVRALGAPAASILHGVSTTASMREIALLGAARRGATLPASLPLDAARDRFGAFADALALDQRLSSARTRALLGWAPRRRSVVEDLLGGIAVGAGVAA